MIERAIVLAEGFGKRVCKGYFAIHTIKQFMSLFE
jgi:hypothetical protein